VRESAIRIYAAACSPDGKTLAGGCSDGAVKLWDIATGRELATLEGHTAAVYTVTFAPDGRALATGGEDFTLRLWDLTTRLAGK
jgi:WD40 repeat protein